MMMTMAAMRRWVCRGQAEGLDAMLWSRVHPLKCAGCASVLQAQCTCTCRQQPCCHPAPVTAGGPGSRQAARPMCMGDHAAGRA